MSCVNAPIELRVQHSELARKAAMHKREVRFHRRELKACMAELERLRAEAARLGIKFITTGEEETQGHDRREAQPHNR